MSLLCYRGRGLGVSGAGAVGLAQGDSRKTRKVYGLSKVPFSAPTPGLHLTPFPSLLRSDQQRELYASEHGLSVCFWDIALTSLHLRFLICLMG